MLIYSVVQQKRKSGQDQRTRQILPMGGQKGRGGRSWRWRGSNATVQGIGARYTTILKRIQEKRRLQEGIVTDLAKQERKEMMNKFGKVKIEQIQE